MCCNSLGCREVQGIKKQLLIYSEEVKMGSIFNQGNMWLPKMSFALELKLLDWESV